jgi:hypothetical protein
VKPIKPANQPAPDQQITSCFKGLNHAKPSKTVHRLREGAMRATLQDAGGGRLRVVAVLTFGKNLGSIIIGAMTTLVHSSFLGGVAFEKDKVLVLFWWCLGRYYKSL